MSEPSTLSPRVSVTFTPADAASLPELESPPSVCIVFDVLRATTTMLAAFAHGAAKIIPAITIEDALEYVQVDPDALLAGERNGIKISSDLTGGRDFDFGNSPRELDRNQIHGRTIVMTTTNGTRVLRSCAQIPEVWIGSFVNLDRLAELIRCRPFASLCLVCAGTGDDAAVEDLLAIGALCELISPELAAEELTDAARIAQSLYRHHADDLLQACTQSRNGRRLWNHPDLKDDLAVCLKRNAFPLLARLHPDSSIRPENEIPSPPNAS